MLKSSLILFTILLTGHLYAQKVTGLVSSNNQRLNNVFIKNISNHAQALSDDRGNFIITAKSGDTLVTLKDYYACDTLVIANQTELVINLGKNPTLLKEVVISSKPITPAATYQADKKEYKDIYFKGDKSHIVEAAIGLQPGIAINIDKVYNALSKQGKDARRMQRTLSGNYKNSVVDRRFNPLVASVTGFKGKQLNDFIANNRPSYDMVIKAKDYDLIQYIRKKLSENKTNNRPPAKFKTPGSPAYPDNPASHFFLRRFR